MNSSSSDEEPGVSDLESSSDDDVVLSALIFRQRPKNANYVAEIVNRYNDQEFFEHFRVSRRVVANLVTQFDQETTRPHQVGPEGKRLSTEEMILIFLWFCGHESSSFRDVADRFDIAISTLNGIVTTIALFLSNLSLAVIKWPSQEEMEESARAFAEITSIRGAIGAIDGTHIRIDKPSEDPDSYYNRKDYFSIQAQAVCDSNRRVIDIFVGMPGSVHDARAFRLSALSDTIEQKCGNFFLFGDSAYPCLYNLIVPFKDRGTLTARQKRFNQALSKGRVRIEQTFGIAKQKFRQLYHLKLRNMEVLVHFIRACFVLHNLALDDQFIMDGIHNDGLDNHHETPNIDRAVPQSDIGPGEEDSRGGVQRRDNLCASM